MTQLPSRVETVVVGAGQSALTMSWYLRRAGRDHVLLERRSELGGGWRDRWDGFRLVGPNWTAELPDFPYDGPDPDGYMPRDEIAGRVAAYAALISAPVVLEAGVSRVAARPDDGFIVETAQGPLGARQVIVATGGFHRPNVPAIAAGLSPRVRSLHSHDYRRPTDLPDGGVLVVGSGQTGVQLVEELRGAGREVWLSVGSAGRVPRRYRGRDIFWWLCRLVLDGPQYGFHLPTVDKLPDPRRRYGGNVQLTGHGEPRTVDLRAWARDGLHLVGRVTGIDGEQVGFGDDLEANLGGAERFFKERFQDEIEGLIDASGMDAEPAEPLIWDGYTPPPVSELDLATAGISTVLWTSGYRQDLSWIDFPVTDELGFAIQREGVSEVPGLSFIGGLWQHDQTSATLFGMPRDARVLAEKLGLGGAVR